MTIKELNFFDVINNSAKELNSRFFVKNGEGRELINSKFDGEDFFGWLIPLDKIEEFKENYVSGENLENWDNFLTFAIWKEKDKELLIEFKKDF